MAIGQDIASLLAPLGNFADSLINQQAQQNAQSADSQAAQAPSADAQAQLQAAQDYMQAQPAGGAGNQTLINQGNGGTDLSGAADYMPQSVSGGDSASAAPASAPSAAPAQSGQNAADNSAASQALIQAANPQARLNSLNTPAAATQPSAPAVNPWEADMTAYDQSGGAPASVGMAVPAPSQRMGDVALGADMLDALRQTANLPSDALKWVGDAASSPGEAPNTAQAMASGLHIGSHWLQPAQNLAPAAEPAGEMLGNVAQMINPIKNAATGAAALGNAVRAGEWSKAINSLWPMIKHGAETAGLSVPFTVAGNEGAELDQGNTAPLTASQQLQGAGQNALISGVLGGLGMHTAPRSPRQLTDSEGNPIPLARNEETGETNANGVNAGDINAPADNPNFPGTSPASPFTPNQQTALRNIAAKLNPKTGQPIDSATVTDWQNRATQMAADQNDQTMMHMQGWAGDDPMRQQVVNDIVQQNGVGGITVGKTLPDKIQKNATMQIKQAKSAFNDADNILRKYQKGDNVDQNTLQQLQQQRQAAAERYGQAQSIYGSPDYMDTVQEALNEQENFLKNQQQSFYNPEDVYSQQSGGDLGKQSGASIYRLGALPADNADFPFQRTRHTINSAVSDEVLGGNPRSVGSKGEDLSAPVQNNVTFRQQQPQAPGAGSLNSSINNHTLDVMDAHLANDGDPTEVLNQLDGGNRPAIYRTPAERAKVMSLAKAQVDATRRAINNNPAARGTMTPEEGSALNNALSQGTNPTEPAVSSPLQIVPTSTAFVAGLEAYRNAYGDAIANGASESNARTAAAQAQDAAVNKQTAINRAAAKASPNNITDENTGKTETDKRTPEQQNLQGQIKNTNLRRAIQTEGKEVAPDMGQTLFPDAPPQQASAASRFMQDIQAGKVPDDILSGEKTESGGYKIPEGLTPQMQKIIGEAMRAVPDENAFSTIGNGILRAFGRAGQHVANAGADIGSAAGTVAGGLAAGTPGALIGGAVARPVGSLISSLLSSPLTALGEKAERNKANLPYRPPTQDEVNDKIWQGSRKAGMKVGKRPSVSNFLPNVKRSAEAAAMGTLNRGAAGAGANGAGSAAADKKGQNKVDQTPPNGGNPNGGNQNAANAAAAAQAQPNSNNDDVPGWVKLIGMLGNAAGGYIAGRGAGKFNPLAEQQAEEMSKAYGIPFGTALNMAFNPQQENDFTKQMALYANQMSPQSYQAMQQGNSKITGLNQASNMVANVKKLGDAVGGYYTGAGGQMKYWKDSAFPPKEPTPNDTVDVPGIGKMTHFAAEQLLRQNLSILPGAITQAYLNAGLDPTNLQTSLAQASHPSAFDNPGTIDPWADLIQTDIGNQASRIQQQQRAGVNMPVSGYAGGGNVAAARGGFVPYQGAQ